MKQPSYDELAQRVAKLEKQLERRRPAGISFRVADKGGVSVYGLGRYPVTLYYEQWLKLLNAADELRTFLEDNKGKLKLRAE